MSDDFVFDRQSNEQQRRRAPRTRSIDRLEWSIAAVVSALVLVLLIVRTTHAGALWRDEAESIQSAQMSLVEMAQNIKFTSFPILFPILVRGYTSLFGASDASLRCFGLVVGISFLGAIWFCLRRLTGEIPFLSLAIIGLNANFLVNGTSLRGYGLGSVLAVLAFAFTAKLLLEQSRANVALAFVACLVSMQCLFFNGALVAAMAVSATAVLLIRGSTRWAGLLIAAAIVCGLSYGPYLLQFITEGRSARLMQERTFGLLWQRFLDGLGESSTRAPVIWLAVICFLLIGGVWRLLVILRKDQRTEQELLLFGVLVIALSIIAYCALLRVLPRDPEPRYFLALTCVIAAVADLLWAKLPRPYWLRLARLALMITAMIMLPFGIWPKLVQAESNANVVAETVEKNAGRDDLIVVNPWSFGVSFNWYYHGAPRWMSVPVLNDHRIHRYDLLENKMRSFLPLEDVKEEMSKTLRSGNRVWFVGQAELPPYGEAPLVLQRAPDPEFGWSIAAYRKAWSQQIGLFILLHVQRTVQEVTPESLVNEREHMMLYQFEGWKD